MLKYPYKWCDRKVLLQDNVLFVPDRLETYDPLEITFGNDHPIHIEYCSGNGAWIGSKALEFPHINWIAVEKKFDRVSKIWKKIERFDLKNLLVICGEGIFSTERYIRSESISHVFVNFPDPWPKKRHWKHRIISPSFLNQTKRILKSDGKMTFVTDDPDYSKVMTEELTLSKQFTPLTPYPFFVTDLPGYGSSYFEDLWRARGKEIFYHQWELCKK